MEIKKPQKSRKQKITFEEHERIVRILHEEILRKDKIIDQLKLENQMLLKTALKRSEVLNDLQKNALNKLEKGFSNRKP